MQCRWVPSLGALEGTHEQAWRTKTYIWPRDRYKDTCFFGLYDLRDYLALWLHKGKKYILWAGSDLKNLEQGFMLNDGKLRTLSILLRRFSKWTYAAEKMAQLLQTADHWVENETEAKILYKFDIEPHICPSFMGSVDDFRVSYKPQKPLNVYLSASEGRQEEYGFPIIERIADKTPEIIYHLFGATWHTTKKNVIVHGRVPKDDMNHLIRQYQCGLRLNSFDGCSEILVKAVLMGQYAIGKVKHPLIPSFEDDYELIEELKKISEYKNPNRKARDYYKFALNKYPWVTTVR